MPTQMEQTCKNCGNTHNGLFCPQCGQRVFTNRFTTKAIIKEFASNILNFDRGFLFTIYSTLIWPHRVISEYVSGLTRKYTNPLRFAIYLLAIATFLLVRSNYFDNSLREFNNILDYNDSKGIESQKILFGYIKNYIQYLTLLIIPFLALTTRWFFKKYNYAEHFIMHCYVYGLLSVVCLPCTLYMEQYGILKVINIAVTIAFYAYVLRKLFMNSIFVTVIKSILFYFIGYILFVFTFGVTAIVVLLIKKGITGHAF